MKRDDSTKDARQAVIWGRHGVAEALRAGHPVNRIYFSAAAGGPQVDEIKNLARERKVRFDFVDAGKLGKLTDGGDHQDVVARISPVAYADLDEVLQRVAALERATVVVLDQVKYARNIGMALRTAVGAGAVAVLLPTRGSMLANDEIVRASAGAIFRLPVVPSANLRDDLEKLKACGFWTYGLDAERGENLYGMRWPGRRVLVVGNESKGLRPSIRKAVDACVRIPLAAELDSLNVAVALGVALFEGVRQDGESMKER